MSFLVFGSILGIIWCFVHLAFKNDEIKTRLESYGISYSIGYVGWYTHRFNPTFIWLGTRFPNFFSAWFTTGVLCGFFTIIGSVVLLLYNLKSIIWSPTGEAPLTPVIPGVNLPAHQFGYYFAALLISGVFHEFGHAIATVTARGRVNGFGIFLMVAYPGAFVDMADNMLESMPKFQQLKIYCAGAWHNIVLSITCLAIMFTVPYLLIPFYYRVDGIVVASVSSESVLHDTLAPLSVITSLNDCPIHDINSWQECFVEMFSEDYIKRRYCIPHDLLANADSEQRMEDPYSFCFRDELKSDRKYCTNIKTVLQNSEICGDPNCSSNSRCMIPILQQDEFLIKINLDDASFLTFIGHPGQIWYSVDATELYPRAIIKWLVPSWLPMAIDKMLHYIFSFSSALAILNMAPVFYLDGSHATIGFLAWLIPSMLTERRKRLSDIIFSATALLLSINIVLRLAQLAGIKF
eukprot:TRINITY_DN10197_c0_g1_i1.p1 TRINITY_DN10197_c0_g1~~TRINITY_DN10197_c0_g1_i1.p1  ORF type:complete len:464 (+),score=76.40 TRINITY_DN10197_c0_g1_i1:1693-3084(+)